MVRVRGSELGVDERKLHFALVLHWTPAQRRGGLLRAWRAPLGVIVSAHVCGSKVLQFC